MSRRQNQNPTPLEIARRNAGLTRKQLEEKSGVPFRTIECYEQEKMILAKASYGTVKALAEALGVSPDEIL